MEISTQVLFPALFSAPPSSQPLLSPKFFCWSRLQAEGAQGSLRDSMTATEGPSGVAMSELQATGHCAAWNSRAVPHMTDRSQKPHNSCSWEGKGEE